MQTASSGGCVSVPGMGDRLGNIDPKNRVKHRAKNPRVSGRRKESRNLPPTAGGAPVEKRSAFLRVGGSVKMSALRHNPQPDIGLGCFVASFPQYDRGV